MSSAVALSYNLFLIFPFFIVSIVAFMKIDLFLALLQNSKSSNRIGSIYTGLPIRLHIFFTLLFTEFRISIIDTVNFLQSISRSGSDK